jgi:hypothetical protein
VQSSALNSAKESVLHRKTGATLAFGATSRIRSAFHVASAGNLASFTRTTGHKDHLACGELPRRWLTWQNSLCRYGVGEKKESGGTRKQFEMHFKSPNEKRGEIIDRA